MELAFYFYTIIVLLISVGSGMISLSAYFVSRNRSFFLAALAFVFYFLDVALIFQFEYIGQNIEFSPDVFYTIDYPFLKIFFALGVIESIFLIACDYLDKTTLTVKIAPALIFVVGCVAVLVFIPEGKWQQWSFYTMRQVFLLICCCYVAWCYLRSKNEAFRMRLCRFKKVFWVIVVGIFLITFEDVLMILVWDPEFDTSLLPLYLSQRNFSENFLMLFLAFISVRNAAKTLRLRFHEPPDPTDNPAIQAYIDMLLPSYCSRHNFTEREKEILLLILQGKDTQNIASELHLATGTVKAHIHNILHKTNHETRRDLVKDFWSE